MKLNGAIIVRNNYVSTNPEPHDYRALLLSLDGVKLDTVDFNLTTVSGGEMAWWAVPMVFMSLDGSTKPSASLDPGATRRV